MSNASKLKRVTAEAWLVVAVVEISLLLGMPFLAPGVSPWLGGLLNMAVLISLCAPVIYWRFAAAFKEFEPLPMTLATARSIKPNQAVTLAVMTQIIGLLLTGGGVWLQNQKLEKFSQEAFDRAAERTQIEIVRRLNQPLYGLQGARAAMAAHPDFKRLDFRAYVAARNLPVEFPGIRGFGFIQRVPRDQLQAFVAAERADNAPEFSVLTTGSAPDLFIIKYIEPFAPNRAALGLDVGQEAVRREAAEKAVDTGKPALSGRVQLVQDQSQTPGFLYFLPVYQKNTRTPTAFERRRDLVGLLYAPIVAAELFRGTTSISDHSVDFAVYEGALDRPEQLIFNSTQDGVEREGAGVKPGTWTGKYSELRALSVGNHLLAIRFNSSPVFDAAQDRSSLTFIGVGGIFLSLLVAVTVWLLAVGRQRAQSLAQTMTAELNRLAQVVQHTESAVSIMDRERRIVWINPGFTHTLGYTLQDAEGKTGSELLSAGTRDAAAVAILHRSFDAVVPCRVELISRHKDGSERCMDVELQPLFDEAKQWVGFMEIAQDITQQKQTQQRLEATLRDVDALLSTLKTHAIVSETDQFGTLTSVNEAFSRISGYSPEELIGQNHRIVKSGVQSAAFWADFWQTIRSGKPWRGEICNRRKDGSLYWVDSMIAPYVGGTGEIERYVSIRTDITDRKQYECSLLEARTVAEQATQSKGEFLANMSHELRTPMNAVLGMLKLLGHTPLSINQLDYVKKTEVAAKSLLALLNDILDFSKMEAEKMELDPQPFLVDRLMRDLAVVLSANVGAKNIEVLYEIDPALPPCLLGDAMRLQQVLINLAGNAVKFTTVGQVVISLKLAAPTPETPEVPQIVFAVQDSGIGIAPENQAKIFTGFSQAEASTSRRFGGTGLGLAISQRLVALMGGRVELVSAVGVGSTFSFKLSLPVAVPEPDAIDTPAPTPPVEARSVLVIDDNAVSCALMAQALRSFGWQVAVAHSGQAGLDWVASAARDGVFPCQCVYVDWQMPQMDGWETVRRLRDLAQRLGGPAPRIVMLSANTRDNLSQRTPLEQDQIGAFLVKPVTPSMLREAALAPPPEGGAVRLAPTSSQRRLEGMRVLVVEDNMINQQVAEELLTIEGALVSIASDGRQGVNAVASATRQFDVVLMDVQMPIMDGYAATRTIREKLGLKRLPIIGLTANAMAADRDACLQAGMNEHVGKPFNMPHLAALILKLTAEPVDPAADQPA